MLNGLVAWAMGRGERGLIGETMLVGEAAVPVLLLLLALLEPWAAELMAAEMRSGGGRLCGMSFRLTVAL